MQKNSKADPQVIAGLNEYLCFEMTGYVQYLFHAELCRHRGFRKLADIQADYSAEETRHASRVMARILLLGAVPAPRLLTEVGGARSVPEQIEADRELVGRAIAHLRQSVGECERSRDFVSRDLLSEMLDDEELHLYWLDKQVSLIGQIGLPNYLQSHT